MIKTFNRAPVTVDIPSQSQVKQYFFNQQNWKGVTDNKSLLTVDQETFADSNNVYVNEEGLLKSRPSLKFTEANEIDNVWEFSNATVYLSGTQLSIFHNNTTYQRDLKNTAVKVLQFENKLYIFSVDDLLAFNLETDRYETAKTLIHIPITKVFGDNSESPVLDKNELSDSEIYTYLYQSIVDADKIYASVNSNIYGCTVYLEADSGEKWYFTFDTVSQNTILDTHNLQNLNLSTSSNSCLRSKLTYSVTNTAVFFNSESNEVYYSLDGVNFVKISIADIPNSSTILDASISTDGYHIAVLTPTGAYFRSIVDNANAAWNWTSLLNSTAEYPGKHDYADDVYRMYVVDRVGNEAISFHVGDVIKMYDSTCFAILQTLESEVKDKYGDAKSAKFNCTYLLYSYDGNKSYFALNFASYNESNDKYAVVNTDRRSDRIYASIDIIPAINDGPVCAILLDSFSSVAHNNSSSLKDNATRSAIIVAKSTDPLPYYSVVNNARATQRQDVLQIAAFNGLLSAANECTDIDFTDRDTSTNGRYCKILNAQCYFLSDFFKDEWHGFTVLKYSFNNTKYDYILTSKTVDFVSDASPLLLSSDMMIYSGSCVYDMTNLDIRYYYPNYESFSMLAEWNNKVVFLNTGKTLVVKTNVVSSVKNLYREINFKSQDVPKYKHFLPDFYTDNYNLYLSKGSTIYISYASEDGKLYFPKIQTNSFADDITGLHPISSTETAVFFENAIYYVIRDTNTDIKGYDGAYRYYKTKLSTGLKKNCDIITTFDGKYIIFPTYRGLAAMTYQEFVATEEQSLTYLSDSICTKFKDFIDSGVRLFKYSFWIIVYKSTSNKLLLLDTRNMSWWPCSYFGNLTKCVGFDEPKFLINNILYKFDNADTEYYDSVDNVTNRKISWFIKSQKLHLNAINYYKHISNMTFVSVHAIEKLGNAQVSNFKLQVNNYRKQVNGTIDGDDYIAVNYNVNAARTYVLRLNYSKVNEFQYLLSSNEANVIDIPLSLNNITIKYKVSNQVR